MVHTTCDTCGGDYHWLWREAFDKFGFNDGDGQVETWQVEAVLVEAGYEVTVESWGIHNTVIISIKRDGQELMPYANPAFSINYDNPHDYLPVEIVALLDEKLPHSGGEP